MMSGDAEKANVGHNLNPTEQTFIRRIRTAKDDHTDSHVGLCFAVCGICLGTLGCQIITLIFSLLPIAMIYFGAKNIHNCTISKFIPIYLLVLGICTLLDQFLIYCQCRNNKEQDAEDNKKTRLGRIFDMFVVVWFIVGSVFVYKIYEPNYDVLLGEYCDKTTYLFAFWAITVVYAMGALIIFSCCCVSFIICCLCNKD